MPSIKVRVPATIANLGPGFDSLGLAVSLFLDVEGSPAEVDGFEYYGDGVVPETGNLVHTGYYAAGRAMNLTLPHLKVVSKSAIPLARGLGSSSAALVAGAVLADELSGHRLGRHGVLRVCAEIEGHPDNVAPAVLGGFTASCMSERGPISLALPFPSGWKLLVATPDSELLTRNARAVLAEEVTRDQAIFNVSRAAVWVAAVATGRFDALAEASRDALHQDARASLIPGLVAAIEAAMSAGAGAAFLSGAGPSVAAVVQAGREVAVQEALSAYAPRVLRLHIAGGYTARAGATNAADSALPLDGAPS